MRDFHKGRTNFLGILLLLGTSACSNPGLYIANTLAVMDNYKVSENIAYGLHKLNKLTVYTPYNNDNNRISIVFFYGGCWGGCETLNKEYYHFVAQAFTAKGFNVIIPDYRRHPEVKFNDIMTDASQAVAWVSQHINNYGGNPDKVFLMGHSAGAHIAVMLTLNETYLPPHIYHNIKGFIGLAGPYDFLPLTDAYQKIVFGPTRNYAYTQPVNFVDGTEPPLLLLYGNADDVVKPVNIESLTRTVKQKGGSVDARRYEGIDHAGILGALSIPMQADEPVLNDILTFIDYYSFDNNKPKKH